MGSRFSYNVYVVSAAAKTTMNRNINAKIRESCCVFHVCFVRCFALCASVPFHGLRMYVRLRLFFLHLFNKTGSATVWTYVRKSLHVLFMYVIHARTRVSLTRRKAYIRANNTHRHMYAAPTPNHSLTKIRIKWNERMEKEWEMAGFAKITYTHMWTRERKSADKAIVRIGWWQW